MPPILSAVLLQAGLPVLVFVVAHMCKKPAFTVIATAALSRSVAANSAVELKTHWVAVEQRDPPVHVCSASSAAFAAVIVVAVVFALVPIVSAAAAAVSAAPVGVASAVTGLSCAGGLGTFLCGVLPSLAALAERQRRVSPDGSAAVGSQNVVDDLDDEFAALFLVALLPHAEIVMD
jgi:hypothetical protein